MTIGSYAFGMCPVLDHATLVTFASFSVLKAFDSLSSDLIVLIKHSSALDIVGPDWPWIDMQDMHACANPTSGAPRQLMLSFTLTRGFDSYPVH